jgi:hypothetical protein
LYLRAPTKLCPKSATSRMLGRRAAEYSGEKFIDHVIDFQSHAIGAHRLAAVLDFVPCKSYPGHFVFSTHIDDDHSRHCGWAFAATIAEALFFDAGFFQPRFNGIPDVA